jgi:hypothetical protein
MACASPDKIVIIPVIFGVRACYGESEDSREVLVIPRRKKEKESNSTERYLLVDNASRRYGQSFLKVIPNG